jgi:hypothetical protein
MTGAGRRPPLFPLHGIYVVHSTWDFTSVSTIIRRAPDSHRVSHITGYVLMS